jgi:hypothetical protein
MADVLLFPAEPNPEDVTLREGGVGGPTTYTVNVSVTAVGGAAATRHLEATRQAGATASGLTAVATTFLPAGEPEPEPEPPTPSRGGGFTRPAPLPINRNVNVAARAQGRANVNLAVDHAGRRHLEDELLLVGVL